MKYKRDLVVRSATKPGLMRIRPEERGVLDYTFQCPRCKRDLHKNLTVNLFAGDLFESDASVSEHLCNLCGGEITFHSKQAAGEQLAKLGALQPQLYSRLLEFFCPQASVAQTVEDVSITNRR